MGQEQSHSAKAPIAVAPAAARVGGAAEKPAPAAVVAPPPVAARAGGARRTQAGEVDASARLFSRRGMTRAQTAPPEPVVERIGGENVYVYPAGHLPAGHAALQTAQQQYDPARDSHFGGAAPLSAGAATLDDIEWARQYIAATTAAGGSAVSRHAGGRKAKPTAAPAPLTAVSVGEIAAPPGRKTARPAAAASPFGIGLNAAQTARLQQEVSKLQMDQAAKHHRMAQMDQLRHAQQQQTALQAEIARLGPEAVRAGAAEAQYESFAYPAAAGYDPSYGAPASSHTGGASKSRGKSRGKAKSKPKSKPKSKAKSSHHRKAPLAHSAPHRRRLSRPSRALSSILRRVYASAPVSRPPPPASRGKPALPGFLSALRKRASRKSLAARPLVEVVMPARTSAAKMAKVEMALMSAASSKPRRRSSSSSSSRSHARRGGALPPVAPTLALPLETAVGGHGEHRRRRSSLRRKGRRVVPLVPLRSSLLGGAGRQRAGPKNV
jgi:hypothetical protein